MFRSFDAFEMPMEEFRKRSAVGGIITLVAVVSASILCLLQLYLYVKGEVREELLMAKSLTSSFLPPLTPGGASYEQIFPKSTGRPGGPTTSSLQDVHNAISKLPIKFKVTFPYIKCRDLDVSHDDARGDDFERIHGKRAYRKFTPDLKLLRESELFPSTKNTWNNPGCVVEGTLHVNKVGGTLSIGVTKEAWNDVIVYMNTGVKDPLRYQHENPGFFNISHYISYMEFGDRFPLSESPLFRSRNIVDNDTGMGIQHVNIKLVATTYKRTGRTGQDMYQVSVAQHTIQPNTLAQQHSPLMPGLVVYYDFSPLRVHHSEERENFLVFLSSLISIFGGVYVTVGLVSRCLVSAASIAKKVD